MCLKPTNNLTYMSLDVHHSLASGKKESKINQYANIDKLMNETHGGEPPHAMCWICRRVNIVLYPITDEGILWDGREESFSAHPIDLKIF